MSAKKSWDIAPSKPARKVAPPAAAPVSRRVPERSPEFAVVARPVRKVSSSKVKSPTLRVRRQRVRRVARVGIILLVLVGIGTGMYALWLPAFRIQTVTADGANTDFITTTAKAALVGTDYHVVPRDSIFFFPEEEIRSKILAADPTIQALSINRSGFNALSIRVITRSVAFWWCGVAAPGNQPLSLQQFSSCYQADASGFLFAPVSAPTSVDASSTPEIPSELLFYAPISDGSSTAATATIGSTVTHAEDVPNILRFAHSLEGLHADIVSVQIRDDEVDLYVRSGTRITYVMGDEDAALARAEAAFPQINLDDGSVQYVDLRFDGKVYLKKNNTNDNGSN